MNLIASRPNEHRYQCETESKLTVWAFIKPCLGPFVSSIVSDGAQAEDTKPRFGKNPMTTPRTAFNIFVHNPPETSNTDRKRSLWSRCPFKLFPDQFIS